MTDRRAQIVDLAALIVAGGLLVALATTWWARIPHPYDLEWMEGGMLGHAWRLQQGQPLYVPPGPDFAPFIYPPGYAGLLAVLSMALPLAPWLGRVVSLAGTLVAAGSIGFVVHRRRRDTVASVLAAACFLGCYHWTGAFYDLVRPDGLLIGLLAASFAVLQLPGRRGWVPAALLLALAVLVKHNAAFFLPAFAAGLGSRDGWRSALGFALTAALPAVLGLFATQALAGEHLWTYLIAVPRSHPLVMERLFPGAWIELAQALPVTSAVAAVWFCTHGASRLPAVPRSVTVGIPVTVGAGLAVTATLVSTRQLGVPTFGAATYLGISAAGAVAAHAAIRLWNARRAPVGPHWIWAISLVATAGITCVWMRAHSGGYLNVYIPAFWLGALAIGVVVSEVPRSHRPAVVGLVGAQLAIQAWLTPFTDLRPTDADVAVGDRLVETLEGLEGPIWSPFASWLPTYAGHAPQAHFIGVMDTDFRDGPLKAELQGFRSAISDQHWGAVVTSQRPIGFGFEEHYRLRTRLHHPAGAFAPPSGWAVRIEGVYVPD